MEIAGTIQMKVPHVSVAESMMPPTSLTHTGSIRSKTAADQVTAEAWVRFIRSTSDWWPSRSRFKSDTGNREPTLEAWPQYEVRFVKGRCQLGVFSWRSEEQGIGVSHFDGFRTEVVQRAIEIADALQAQFVEERDDPSP